jgi:hypothetical protein
MFVRDFSLMPVIVFSFLFNAVNLAFFSKYQFRLLALIAECNIASQKTIIAARSNVRRFLFVEDLFIIPLHPSCVARVAKPGQIWCKSRDQRRETQDLFQQWSAGSNPAPRTIESSIASHPMDYLAVLKCGRDKYELWTLSGCDSTIAVAIHSVHKFSVKAPISVKLLYEICYWRTTQPERAGDNPNPLKAIFLNRGENVVIIPLRGKLFSAPVHA